jgi:hypothetical protein
MKCQTQFWRGTTKGSFQQSLVEIGSVVSEEKILLKFHQEIPIEIFLSETICSIRTKFDEIVIGLFSSKNVVGITVIFASPLSGYRFQVKLSYNYYTLYCNIQNVTKYNLFSHASNTSKIHYDPWRNKCEISKSIAENFIIIL